MSAPAEASDASRRVMASRLFFILNLLAVSGIVIGSNLGTALFLETYGAKYLPHAFVLVALVAIAAERILRKLEQRIEPMKLLSFSLYACMAAIVLVWSGIAANFRAATVLLYILPELAAFVIFSQVWNLASRHFDFSESKKNFPLIAAGGSLGGAIGGAGVTLISGVTSPVHALALWLFGLLMMPFIIAAIERGGTAVEIWKPTDDKPEHARGTFLRRTHLRIRTFFSQAFLLIVCVYVILGAVLTQLLDFQSQFVFGEVYSSPAELARFLGLFTSLSFVAGLLLQTLILSPLVRKIGAGNAAFIFPLCTAGAGLFLARWPGLPAAVSGAFTRRYLKGSFFTVLVDILLNALHPQERSRMRSLLKGPIAAVTTIVASLVILAVQDAGGLGDIAMLTVFFGITFICTAFILRRKYVACLIEQIGKGRSGFSESTSFSHGVMEVDIHPDHYIATLEKADDDVAMLLFEEYRNVLSDGVIDRLPELHARSSDRVRGAIVKTVRARMREKDRPWLESLLRSTDEESVSALFMVHGDFMEPFISEQALDLMGDAGSSRRLKRAALYHLCLSPSQYFAYKGHLKLKETIHSGDKDELLWALEIVRNLEERKLMKEFESFLSEPDVIDAWLMLMEKLEDGRDDIFAATLLKLFRTDNVARRRTALKILERIPAHDTFGDLWEAFGELPKQEQEIVLRMGSRGRLLGAEELAPLLTTAALPADLFLLCCTTWKSLDPSKTKAAHEERITANLLGSLDQARADYAAVSAFLSTASDKNLTAIVLKERMLQLVDKSLAWKALVIMPLDAFDSVYQGLISHEKGTVDRAMETIENSGGVADAAVVKELRDLFASLRGWTSAINTEPAPSSSPSAADRAGLETCRDVLVRLASDRDPWLVAVALSDLGRHARTFRVTRGEMESRLRPSLLRDPFALEALSLLPARAA